MSLHMSRSGWLKMAESRQVVQAAEHHKVKPAEIKAVRGNNPLRDALLKVREERIAKISEENLIKRQTRQARMDAVIQLNKEKVLLVQMKQKAVKTRLNTLSEMLHDLLVEKSPKSHCPKPSVYWQAREIASDLAEDGGREYDDLIAEIKYAQCGSHSAYYKVLEVLTPEHEMSDYESSDYTLR